MPKCPWKPNRTVPRDCKTCMEYDEKKGCLKTYYAQHPDTAPWPRGSPGLTRRKTDGKEARLGQNATPCHSPTLGDRRTLTKHDVAEHVLKTAISDSDEKPCKNDVEGQRNMRSSKNTSTPRNPERPWNRGRSWYKDYFWCTHGCGWIPQKTAKYNTRGTALCPRCGKRLRTKPAKNRKNRPRTKGYAPRKEETS